MRITTTVAMIEEPPADTNRFKQLEPRNAEFGVALQPTLGREHERHGEGAKKCG